MQPNPVTIGADACKIETVGTYGPESRGTALQSGGVEEGPAKGGAFPLFPLTTTVNTIQISKAKRAKRGYALVGDSFAN